MDLPNVFSKKKQANKNELFITLLLTSSSVNSALWRVSQQKISILNRSKLRFYQTNDEQLVECDESLQDLGKESEQTDQALFALEPDWATQTEISPPYDARLQELCESLSLTAVGFVLTTEALTNHLLQENPYLSALILYIGASSLFLSTIHQGQQQQSLSVGRSENIVQDVQEALARLKQESTETGFKLPLNIILASASLVDEELTQYQQQLFALNWTQDLDFIQTPLIELVTADDLLEMVVRHGGLATAKDQGLVVVSTQSTSPELTQESDFSVSAGTLGTAVSDLPTSFGVPIGLTDQAMSGTQTMVSGVIMANQLDNATNAQRTSQPKTQNRFLSIFSKRKKSGSQDALAISLSTNSSKLNKKKKIVIFVVLGVFLGLVVSVLAFYLLLQRNYQLLVQVRPQVQLLDKEVAIMLDANINQSDPEKNLLKAEILYQEVEEVETVKTTGVKMVGEKAQGEVRIVNKTDADKTFAKGTLLKTNSLEFSLDDEVVVPAAKIEVNPSGDGENKVYGQKEVEAIAIEIGTESNIGKDTDLQLESFSDDTYSAKSTKNFEGGSSREIRVVSDVDHKELLVSLRQKLLKQAQEKMLESESGGKQIIPTEVFEIISQDYSAEIGDEQDDISLTLRLKLQGLAYTNSDLVELAQAVLAEEVPEGYEFIDERPDLLSQSSESPSQAGQAQIDAKISGRVRGIINVDELKKQLFNLSMDEAKLVLKDNKLIASSNLSLSPRVASWFFNKTPSQIERVEIQLE